MSIELRVIVGGLSHIEEAAREIRTLAKRVRVTVSAEFNGVLIWSEPHSTIKDIVECYYGEFCFANPEAERIPLLEATEHGDTQKYRKAGKYRKQ